MDYKFDIIIGEHTPKIEKEIENPKQWAIDNAEKIKTLKQNLTLKNAIGLAANQCSLNGERIMEKFFLERDYINEKEYCSPCDQKWDIFINPEIVETIGITDKRIEGCLTWPNKGIFANRYRQIKVKYYDIDGKLHEEHITGFRAHIWQHEMDHLNGTEEIMYDPKVHGEPATLNEKYQRNDDCPCGSGKKYKKCCGIYEIN